MTREEAKDEIESMLSRMMMQAQGMMDYLPETSPAEAAEEVLEIAMQVSGSGDGE